MIRFLIILVFLGVGSTKGFSFYCEDCTSLVAQAFEKVGTLSGIDKGKSTWYMYYTTTVKSRTESESYNQSVQIASANGCVLLQQGNTFYLKDSAYSYIIYPFTKRITKEYIGGKNKSAQPNKFQEMNNLVKGFIQKCKVKEYKDGEVGGVKSKIITLEASEEVRNKYGYETLKCWVNEKNGLPLKYVSYYNESSKIESVEVQYHEISFDYKKMKLSYPVSQIFMNEKGKMKDAYKDFKLIDPNKNN